MKRDDINGWRRCGRIADVTNALGVGNLSRRQHGVTGFSNYMTGQVREQVRHRNQRTRTVQEATWISRSAAPIPLLTPNVTGSGLFWNT